MATLIERIDERCKVLELSRRKASIKAGLSPDYIRDLARKKSNAPGLASIERLAEALECTVEWLRGDDAKFLGAVTPKPEPTILGEVDLPVFRSVEAGTGYIVVSSKPHRFVRRPSQLENNDKAFAVVVSGESMSPEYEPGDMLFVDPYAPLVKDRNFIFVDDRHGEFKACVKKLRKWDASTYYVFQHNPPREFELKRDEWPTAQRVLGKYDRD